MNKLLIAHQDSLWVDVSVDRFTIDKSKNLHDLQHQTMRELARGIKERCDERCLDCKQLETMVERHEDIRTLSSIFRATARCKTTPVCAVEQAEKGEWLGSPYDIQGSLIPSGGYQNHIVQAVDPDVPENYTGEW